MDRRAGRIQAYPVIWTTATVRKRPVRDATALAYMRRYLGQMLAKNPDVVVIYIGVNDVWHKMRAGTGTDPDKFEKFYLAIIRKLKQRNIRVILCTPAAIGEKTDFSNQQDGDLNAYSTIIRNLAASQQLDLVDLRTLVLDYDKRNNPKNLDRGILTTDGVHLNAAGNEAVAGWMWNVIKK